MRRHHSPDTTGGNGPLAAPALRLALLSGGDERLAIDPRSGRNRYGVPADEAPGEVFFASSTASPLSPRGRTAAAAAFARLMTGENAAAWADSLRERLRRHVGVPECEVILTGSGTEAELVLLTLATELLGSPLTNIVMAPGETGSGVALAAAGRHFLDSASCASRVEKGAFLKGFADRDIATEGLAIRDDKGQPLPADAIDMAAAERVAAAVKAGRGTLVHCLDTSKTGLSGLRRSAAAALAAAFPGKVLVVVDACQLRCSAEEIREDLASGFFVLITGSKFLGGPPFSGAVLVPPSAAGRLRRVNVPPGLAAYSAAHDWPASLRADVTGRPLPTTVNMGLGLRWEAALAEWDALAARDPIVRHGVTSHLGAMIRDAVSAYSGLTLLDCPNAAAGRLPTIFPVQTVSPDGIAPCAKTLHRALMQAAPSDADGSGRAFHVGQPVSIGPRDVLRICLGAPQIVDVATRLAAGRSMDDAARPFAADLDDLLVKWDRLRVGAVPARRRA